MKKAGLVGLAMLMVGSCTSPSPSSSLPQSDERCPGSSVRYVLQDKTSYNLLEVSGESLDRTRIPPGFRLLKGCQGEPELYSNFDRVKY